MNWYNHCGLAGKSDSLISTAHSPRVLSSFEENRVSLETNEQGPLKAESGAQQWKGTFDSGGEFWVAHFWRPFNRFTHLTWEPEIGRLVIIPLILTQKQYETVDRDIPQISTAAAAANISSQLADVALRRPMLIDPMLNRILSEFTDNADILKFDGFSEQKDGAEIRFATTTATKSILILDPMGA